MNLSTKQDHGYREHTGGCQEERAWEEGQRRRLGLHRMNKQGASIQHRELYPISYDKPQWKGTEKKGCIHMYNSTT